MADQRNQVAGETQPTQAVQPASPEAQPQAIAAAQPVQPIQPNQASVHLPANKPKDQIGPGSMPGCPVNQQWKCVIFFRNLEFKF